MEPSKDENNNKDESLQQKDENDVDNDSSDDDNENAKRETNKSWYLHLEMMKVFEMNETGSFQPLYKHGIDGEALNCVIHHL